MDEHTHSAHGVGESEAKGGEEHASDMKEAGRHDRPPQGQSERPAGASTPRDVTGVAPEREWPINKTEEEAPGGGASGT